MSNISRNLELSQHEMDLFMRESWKMNGEGRKVSSCIEPVKYNVTISGAKEDVKELENKVIKS